MCVCVHVCLCVKRLNSVCVCERERERERRLFQTQGCLCLTGSLCHCASLYFFYELSSQMFSIILMLFLSLQNFTCSDWTTNKQLLFLLLYFLGLSHLVERKLDGFVNVHLVERKLDEFVNVHFHARLARSCMHTCIHTHAQTHTHTHTLMNRRENSFSSFIMGKCLCQDDGQMSCRQLSGGQLSSPTISMSAPQPVNVTKST